MAGEVTLSPRTPAGGCRHKCIYSHLPAEAPERFSCALSILADFTQLLMMLASSLRTSVTDGGSAGLCPLEKAEQCELVSGQQLFAFCTGKAKPGN